MLELRALADPAVLTRTISVRARSLSLVSGLIISVWASVQQHQKKKKKKEAALIGWRVALPSRKLHLPKTIWDTSELACTQFLFLFLSSPLSQFVKA